MKTLFALFALCLLTACKDGPNGPNPGQELSIVYSQGILNGIKLNKAADLQMHGDLVRPTFVYFEYDELRSGEIRFDLNPIQTFNTPEIRLIFKGGLPTAPGTFAWEATKVTAGGANVTVTAGPVVTQEFIQYFPVSGETVVTGVNRDGAGNITHIDGYFNGKLRAQWPDGGTIPNPLPPDFDPANPTLLGPNLTVSSCQFFTRSAASIPPVQ